MTFSIVKSFRDIKSIRVKLMFSLFSVAFLVIIVFSTANYVLFIRQLNQEVDVRLENTAHRVTGLFSKSLWDLNAVDINKIAVSQTFLEELVLLRVYNNFDELMYESDKTMGLEHYRLTSKDVLYKENVVGMVEIGLVTDNIAVARNAIIRATLVIIFAVLFSIVGLTFFIARSISKPIKDLTDIAGRVASGDFKVKASVTSKDEIGTLGKTFNFMTEKLKKQIKELQELDRLKNDFLNNTTHELKTPLIPIKSQAQLLLSGGYGELSKEQKDAIDMIFKSEARLENLISDIMDISKSNSKKIKYVFEKTNLSNIITESVNNMKVVADERKVNLTLISIPELPKLTLDARRITQVIGNLLNNALKFTPEGGNIIVEVKKGKKMVTTTVSDTGIGMNKETLSKLFTPFFQADSNIARKYPGTGLGLSISKIIVEAHGGTIKVESKGEGKGSTFVFDLPLLNKN